MSPVVAGAIPLGIGLGLGLWTLVALIPRFGAPRLGVRVAHALTDVSAEARELVARRPAEPASALLALAAPAIAAAQRLLARVLGGDDEVARRLRRAGSASSVAAYRSRQLVTSGAGSAAGVAVAAVLAHATAASGLVLGAVIAIGLVAGALAPDQLLTSAGRSRQRRIAAELPTVLEFLALALSAGEGVLDALRRVARTGNGELAHELGRTVAEVNAGTPLPEALTRSAAALDLPALTRTVDQLIAALDRGTPLVGVLRAQAQDAREDAKRRLLESAGRKEVAMLVPLVFGVLPVTIAFAIFPGLLVLRAGF
ncbi:MAG: type II secretion system F family protein [Microbacteriaceae bacterium]|nr:type II secretion system F family protein [Microbacteriaceae bacterium]